MQQILKKEIEDLSKFQEALLESMNTSDKISMDVMNDIIKQVSEMSITMQSIESLSRNDEPA